MREEALTHAAQEKLIHVYEVQPRRDKRGVDLVAMRSHLVGANAIGYAEHRSRSHDAVIRVYDAAGNVIETHQHKVCFNRMSR